MIQATHPTSRVLAPLALAGLAASLLTGAAGATGDERPNMLFIFSDDHAAQAISAYGSNRNSTPNIDSIAEQGMLFENCFCGNSICGPSRATVLTGLHSHANGFIDNRSSFDGSQQTFPKLLQSAGYQTAIVGKWHLRTDPTGFDHWEVLIGQGPYYNPPIKSATGTTRHEGYTTEIITDLSLQWLREGRDPERPFLLMYQHKAPHRNWQPGPRELGMFEGFTFEEPATLFDDWERRNSGAKTQEMTVARHLNESDLKLKAPGNLTDEQREAWDAWYGPQNAAFKAADLGGKDLVRWKYQRYMQDYMASIAAVDRGVGQVLGALEELGLQDDTIVVYSSDQGFYLGEHGWYDKRWMYEESLRMPLVVRWPGRIEPGTRNSGLIQNIDFAPTLLDLAGVTEIDEPMHGQSFAPMLLGQEPSDWRTSIYYHYYEFPGAHSVPRHHGVRTETHKLIRYEELGEWELFDLNLDPDELRSVADDPVYSEIRASLEAELARLAVFYGEPDPSVTGRVADQERYRKRAGRVKPAEVFHLESAASPAPPAPDLAGKPFTVAALVDGTAGVVAAQGGASYGYALRLEAGVPILSLTNRDQRFEVRGKVLPPGPHHLAGSLDASGQMRLHVEGRLVAQGDGEVLEQMPSDGLSLGRDSGSPVGSYTGDQALQGTWTHLRFAWGADHDLAAWARAARGR